MGSVGKPRVNGFVNERNSDIFMINGKPVDSNSELPLSSKYTRISFGKDGEPDSGSLKYQQIYNGNIYIADIHTYEPKRGRGVGSTLLNRVFELADKKGLAVEVFASPTDKSMTEEQLYKWYENRGFVRQYDNQKWGDTMIRMPNRKK